LQLQVRTVENAATAAQDTQFCVKTIFPDHPLP
jgi:hypothetical protein